MWNTDDLTFGLSVRLGEKNKEKNNGASVSTENLPPRFFRCSRSCASVCIKRAYILMQLQWIENNEIENNTHTRTHT